MESETAAERARRRHQRALFDRVADLYEETRPGYPAELVQFVAATAGVSAGDPVLEVGCGTGQLTRLLAGHGFDLTAIDLGASMTQAAGRRVAGAAVSFWTGAFEDLDAPDGSFSLIISGAAFHWIDPEVRFVKSARLLRPGGWLAVVGNSDRYDEPLESELEGMWRARADINGSWETRRVDAEVMAGTGLFGTPVHRTWTQRMTRSVADVVGVENTRAISLSMPEGVRAEFSEELRQRVAPASRVGVTVRSPVTMAPVLG